MAAHARHECDASTNAAMHVPWLSPWCVALLECASSTSDTLWARVNLRKNSRASSARDGTCTVHRCCWWRARQAFPRPRPTPVCAGTPTTRHTCCTAGLHPQHNRCCAPTPAPGSRCEDAPPELWGPTLHVTYSSTALKKQKNATGM